MKCTWLDLWWLCSCSMAQEPLGWVQGRDLALMKRIAPQRQPQNRNITTATQNKDICSRP
eukprot:3992462-Amphidinium_carterae.1